MCPVYDATKLSYKRELPFIIHKIQKSNLDRTNTEGIMDDQLRIPDSMVACVFRAPSHLSYTSAQTPGISATKFLIRVHTLSISPYERRYYSSGAARVVSEPRPGLSFCGSVVATPTRDHWSASGPKFKVGDEVIGIIRIGQPGAAAGYVLADGDDIAFKPSDIGMLWAAALPTPALLAWSVLLRLKKLANQLQHAREPKQVRIAIGRDSTLRHFIAAMLQPDSVLGTEQFVSSWANAAQIDDDKTSTVIVTVLPLNWDAQAKAETDTSRPEVAIDLVPATSQMWMKIFHEYATDAPESDLGKPDLQAILNIFSSAFGTATSSPSDTFDISDLPDKWEKNGASDQEWLVGVTESV